MIVAVTASQPSLDSELDPRFGRCPYFLIIDTNEPSLVPLRNESMNASSAGIQAAQTLAHHGVQTVLTGNCGPNAHQTLSAAGISVVVGCSGIVSAVVEEFKSGKLRPTDSPNAPRHHGTTGG